MSDDPSNLQAGRGRRVQVTSRGRARFDKRKRRIFLEWFAATCNAQLAARKAGVNYRTPYRTRMNDAAFAEAWDRALEQGYARLEAKLLEAQFRQASGEVEEFHPAFGVRDDPPSHEATADKADGALTDPSMAFQLLRQHKPEVMRMRGSRGAVASGGRLASDAEVRRALVQGLRAFGIRVTKEDLTGDDEAPPPRDARPPSPSKLGEDE